MAATRKPPRGRSQPAPAAESAPTADVGDRVCVAAWRPTPGPRPGERPGAWTTVWGRVVAVRRDGSLLCYETDSNPPAEYDTPAGSRLRYASPDLCFPTQAAADEACRALPDPQ